MNQQSASDLPGGTVTFLFTDIQSSTQLLLELREVYAELLAQHHALLRAAISNWHGQEVDTQGDAFFVSFARASEAVRCVVEIQRALAEHTWSQGVEVRVRMGLHTGEPLVAGEGYVGMDVHRAARIAHVGHGGQVLLSETTAALIKSELPEGVELLGLGRHRLKDIRQPEHIQQLVIEGLPSEFPPLTSLEALPPETYLDPGAIQLPAFLEGAEVERLAPVFVGRQRELAFLDEALDRVLAGQGGVVFLTGGPGRGKTALLEAFARRAMESQPDLLLAFGSGKAQSGLGDPYLPFRDALDMLSGEVGARWASGSLSSAQATRLWNAGPLAAQAIVDHGPNLVGVLVSGKDLLERISVAVPEGRNLIGALRAASERELLSPGELEQRALFEQYQSVLSALSERGPLVLLLDDLQWADNASIDLLFHLARGLEASRILLVCAYRPEEVALGRRGERHPLESVLSEVKRQYGQVWLDLSAEKQKEGRDFVEDLLDSQPNRLRVRFREGLYRHTEGHPLFTVELLRDLQERGDLIKDEEGFWVEGPELDWETLPARVEGVIEARIGRLEEELRETLTVASVEGEDFTAQVVAQVQELGERQILRKLSTELEKRHRLVHGQGETQVGEVMLSRYHFTHSVIQRYLYNSLSPGERRLLNGEVAGVLEKLYAGRTDEICAQLARHYWESGKREKAVEYLLLAGDRARNLYAHQEAIQAYQAALEILKEQGENERAARTLMKLGLAYHTAFDYQRSKEAYDQAFELWQQVAPSPIVGPATPAAHTLRLDINPGPSTIDPCFSSDIWSGEIIDNLFSGLVQVTPEMDILSDSAHSWEITEAGRKYVFHLRPDLRWSDGQPVTAGDFEYAWKRVLNPEIGSPNAEMLCDIKGGRAYHLGQASDAEQLGVKALDPLTLVVELEEPTGYFLSLISHATALPVPRHVLEKYGEDWTEVGNIVSNGPYQLEIWQPGKSLSLARNPYYHGQFKGNLERVELTNVSAMDWQEQLGLYEADELDGLSIPSNQVMEIKRRLPGDYLTTQGMRISYLLFNTAQSPLDDARIRRALVMAIDMEEYVRVVSGGVEFPATGGLIPPDIPGHSPGIGLPYDPEAARQLLAEAGYPGGRGLPELRALIYSYFVNSIEYLKSRWQEALGVDLTWEVMNNKRNADSIEKESPHMLFFGWGADYPDPDNFLRVAFAGFDQLMSGWHNDRFDSLLERARRSLDQAERVQLYRAVDQILIDEAVVKPIVYNRGHLLEKSWVKSQYFMNRIPELKDVTIEPGAQKGLPQGPQVYPAASPLPTTPVAGPTFRVGIHPGVDSIDPCYSSGTWSSEILSQLFSGLVQFTAEMDILPDSARSWEISDGGRQYVFHLRPDIRWSDGRPVTAGDFEYAWERVLDPASASKNAEILYDLKGARAYHQGHTSDAGQVEVKALDPLTLFVELEEPAGYFLSLISHVSTYPVPRHVLDRFGDDWTAPGVITSNGPFMLESWQPGTSLTMVRNRFYHGQFPGNLVRVERTNLEAKTLQELLGLYAKDELDSLILPLPRLVAKDLDQIRKRYPGEYRSTQGMRIQYLLFNTQKWPLDDRRVRRALVMAINNQEMVQIVAGGAEIPATGGLIPPGIPGHSPGAGLPYDPETARRMLSEAGYPGGRGLPEIKALTAKYYLPFIEYLAARWREELGVNQTWELVDRLDISDLLKEKLPHLIAEGWVADYPDPDNFLRVGLGAHRKKWSGWHNAEFESLLQQAKHSLDQSERIQHYRAADQILIDDAVVKPVVYQRGHLLVKPWVQAQYFMDRIPDLKDVTIEPGAQRGLTHEPAIYPAASPKHPPPTGSQTLRLVKEFDPFTLDPGLSGDSESGEIIKCLFSGLLEYTPEGDVVPDIAERWDISEGGRKYMFHLRGDARWSDGNPVTAMDFVYAWKRVLNPATQSPAAGLLYDIVGARSIHQGDTASEVNLGIIALDAHRLQVELEAPTGYFLQLLAHNTTFPVPSHVVHRYPKDWTRLGNIICNGPFVLENWQAGKSISLVRNPEYYGRLSGNIERVEITISPVSERAVRIAMYQADVLDIMDISYFTPAEIVDFRRQHRSEYVSAPGSTSFYLVFNMGVAPFDDIRIRRAFMMSVDRQSREHPVSGSGLYPAKGGIIPPGLPGHSPDIGLPYNPHGARELMASAGYPGGRNFPLVELMIWPEGIAQLENLRLGWRENLGVEVTWVEEPIVEIAKKAEVQPPHLAMMGWGADYPDPDNFLRVGFRKEWTGWQASDFERLIERARHTLDQAERIELYRQADKLLIDEAVVLPLSYNIKELLVKPWVKNYPVSALSDLFLKQVTIEPGAQKGLPQEPVIYPAVSPKASTPTGGQTLRLDIDPGVDTLDPGYAYDSWSELVIRNLFSGLVQVSPEKDILPDTARSWEILESGRQYIFHLRPDLRWSDGQPLTAHDFEYAWKRVLDPQNDSKNAHLLYDVKGAQAFHLGQASGAQELGVKALDPLTLWVELDEPAGYFLSLLAHNCSFPVPRHVLEKYGDDWTLAGNLTGNGPFQLLAWQPEKPLTLVRNPHYHGVSRGNAHRVELNLSGMAWQEKETLYQAGKFDILYIPTSEYQHLYQIRNRYPHEYRTNPVLLTRSLVFNTSLAPLDDRRVRRALVMAIDKNAWAQVVFGEAENPATGGFIPPGVPGHSSGIGLPYDPESALQLLAEAGYPGGRGLPVIQALLYSSWKSQYEYFKSQWWQTLGVVLSCDFCELGSILDRLASEKVHVSTQGWRADYPDPDTFLRIGFGARRRELSAWKNEEFDRLMQQAKHSLDQAERLQFYRAADQILIEEAVVMPLRYDVHHLLVKPWVKNPVALLNDNYKDVILEPH